MQIVKRHMALHQAWCSSSDSISFMVRLASLVFLLAYVAPLSWAQATFVTEPGTFSHGDEISLRIDYAGEGLDSLHLVYHPDNYVINPASEMVLADMDTSWFCPNPSWRGILWLDSVKNELHITLIRTDTVAVSGMGFVARVVGITVTMEDMLRQRSPMLEHEQGWNISPNPVSSHLRLEVPEGQTVSRVEVCDPQGRVMYVLPAGQSVWERPPLAAGLYLLHVHTKEKHHYWRRFYLTY